MHKVAFTKVKLNPRQRRLWDDTLSALSWIGPGFMHIIYTMLQNTGDDEVALFTEEIDYEAATDGLQLIFKPSGFFKRTLMKRVFMVLHEVMHEILNHCRASHAFALTGTITVAGRTLPFDRTFANIVQDLVINAILIITKMGEFDEAWLYDKDLNADQKDWISLYFELFKLLNPPPQGLPGQGKPCDGGPGNGTPPPIRLPGAGKTKFDDHLEPGESTGKDAHEIPERNEAAWEIAVNTAMEIQRAQGKLPAAMEHFFQSVLRPVVEWSDHVRGEITRISGSGAYDFQRLDRRLIVRGIGAPGITGHSCDVIVVGIDSSGSVFVDKTLLARFVGETAGILEDLNPREVHLVVCDAEVKQVHVITDVDDLRRIGVLKGGGGTSFVPVFDYIENNNLVPDALIYLTDLEGRFPEQEPDFPVIWGNINPTGKAPWGKVVFIPTSED